MGDEFQALSSFCDYRLPQHFPSERPLHPKEKVLEQALQWCQLPEPCSASLLLRKVSMAHAGCLFTGEPPPSAQHSSGLSPRSLHPALLFCAQESGVRAPGWGCYGAVRSHLDCWEAASRRGSFWCVAAACCCSRRRR